MATSRPNATLRLRQYTPLGGPLGIVPDLGMTVVSGPDGGTLQATISSAVANALPDDCEVAAEIYDDVSGQWIEGNDSRFVLVTHDLDDRDPTGTVTLTGVALPVWMAQKAALASTVPYSDAGNVEAAASGTGISISGTTFTWGSHILGEGDRVRITDSGKSKGLSKGAVYYVRSPGTSTFQLSHTASGKILKFGSSHTVKMERVRTRIVNLNGHKFAKNMAISVWDANANQALTNGSQYYVVNPTPSTIQVAAKPGGLPIELTADSLIVYRYLDGQRVWKNATAGQVIEDAFLEARDRGWGQDASGTDQVWHSWSDAADSNSLVWPARVDDPTIAGVSVGFQPGTSLWDMVTFMLTNAWAEFGTQGRNFNLYAPLTGTDYSTGSSPRILGGAASAVPITKDLTDYRTTEIVRGEGPIEVVVKGTRSPWGQLELYVTASGVTTASHATSYGRNDLSLYSKPQKGYTVTEPAAAAQFLPIFEYQRGDWVLVSVAGTLTKLRVTQWTLTKAADGTLSVSTLLEAKKRSILHKLAKSSRKAHGGRMPTSSSTTPVEIDKRKASKPQQLSVVARATYAADRSARAHLTASWLPVTTDDGGDDLTGAQYEVLVRPEGEQEGKVVTTTKHTSVDLPAHPSGALIAVSVRAISSAGEAGELTDEVEYTVDGAAAAPDAPTAPTVTTTLGSVMVAWDGTLVDPIDGPILPSAGFAYVQVQRSADGGTTWTTEAQTLPAAGSVTDLGLTVGSSYAYQLLAVDALGNVSAPSSSTTVTVVGVDTAQINADFTAQVTKASSDAAAATTAAANAQTVGNNAAATASAAQAAANAASTAASNASSAAQAAQTTANAAQTSANGKNTNHYSTAAPSGSGVAGDEWFQVDASGNVLAQWVWTVTGGSGAWASSLLTGAVLTSLDAGKITTGTLNAARIGAGTITANLIAVADFTNVASGSDFENPAANPWPSSTSWAPDTSQKHSGTTSFRCTGSAPAASSTLAAPTQTAAGDVWYVELWAYCDSAWNGTTANSKLRFGNQGGGLITALTYAAADLTPGTWVKRSLTFTAPSGATGFQVGLTTDATAGNLWVDDIIIRRKSAGTMIVDGTLTATQIQAASITGDRLVANTITAGQIAANTITAAQIAASTITTAQIAANTIQAGDIAANTITAAQLSATAIDTMTLTGATIRTASTAKTSGGVQLDSTGLHAYNASGVATVSIDTAGNASFNGSITATSGAISGTLTISGSGQVFTGSTASGQASTSFSTAGVSYVVTGTIRQTFGQVNDHDSLVVGTAFNYQSNASYAIVGVATATGAVQGTLRVRSVGGVVIQNWDGTSSANTADQIMVGTGGAGGATSVPIQGTGIQMVAATGPLLLQRQVAVGTGWRNADFKLDDDGSPKIVSNAILNRLMTTASTWPGAVANGGTAVGSTTAFVSIDSNGVLGRLDGSPRFPSAYSDSITTRALYVGSTGQLGTTSSSIRTKNLHQHMVMDDAAMEAWLGLNTWEFDYKADPDHVTQYGLVAEEVDAAGYKWLVYYDEQPGETQGQIDGFAYEKMGVMNRMAIQRLYARLQQLEQKVATMGA